MMNTMLSQLGLALELGGIHPDRRICPDLAENFDYDSKKKVFSKNHNFPNSFNIFPNLCKRPEVNRTSVEKDFFFEILTFRKKSGPLFFSRRVFI